MPGRELVTVAPFYLLARSIAGSFLFVFLLGSCTQSPGTPPVSNTPIEPGENWTIKLSISGGFAGLQRVVEISNSGQLTVTDQKSNRQVTIQVPNDELANIEVILAETKPPQSPSRPPTCQDCFQYELDVQMEGKDYTVLLNDINLPDSGVDKLINALVDLQERALAGQMKP